MTRPVACPSCGNACEVEVVGTVTRYYCTDCQPDSWLDFFQRLF